MKNIKDFKREDFLGFWKSTNPKITFFLDKTQANLVLPNKQIYGDFIVNYVLSCEECTNCLEIGVNNDLFFIKQITENGFFLTTEYGEILLTKIVQEQM
ncbi:MAG: hypothetical protein JJU34_02805 [Lunatimonas sp.]|uniref:hypothetical protein n=1 Tax=Lunatimonas sp. TaxID=2060141 RepID=UPI00263ACB99|nr:hypothetical protein [Lunatimonas sp.]MCC5936190.1 hypothetical protein [Lunatimonas sp.]